MTTPTGAGVDAVRDGETGLVTSPDPSAVADAFDRLFSDRALASRMGDAGRELLESEVPAWPEVVARLLA